MTMSFTARFGAAFLPVALAVAGPAFAAGSDTGSSTAPATPSAYEQAKAAADAGQYPLVLKILATVVKAEPRNADALNMMGYANRKMKRFNEAARYYNAALKADPQHLGALEYQGELFVETGDYNRARDNLNRLGALCGTCEQYNDLHMALMSAGQG